MFRVLWVLAASVIAASLFAQSASAAMISNFSYTVTGGTFDGPYSTGPITGGAASFTPTVAVQTGTPAFFVPGTIRLTLFGPTGYFRLLPKAVFGTVDSNQLVAGIFGGYFSAVTGIGGPVVFFPRGSGPFAGAFVGLVYRHSGCAYCPLGDGDVGDFLFPGGPYTAPIGMKSHSFTLGSEVRTVVPEPASASLLGLGLLALAVAGRSAAGVRRTRRR